MLTYEVSRCVLRYDHHCAALGTCVGLGNYGAFLLFCSSLLVSQGMALYIMGPVHREDTARLVCHHILGPYRDTVTNMKRRDLGWGPNHWRANEGWSDCVSTLSATVCLMSFVTLLVMRTYADVCGRMRTYADVCRRMQTYADAY